MLTVVRSARGEGSILARKRCRIEPLLGADSLSRARSGASFPGESKS